VRLHQTSLSSKQGGVDLSAEPNNRHQERGEYEEKNNFQPPSSGQSLDPLIAFLCDCLINPILLTAFFFLVLEALENVGEYRFDLRQVADDFVA